MSEHLTVPPGTLLLVEDDAGVRTGLAEMLRCDGFSVADFPHPRALPQLTLLGGVALVSTDYQMPEEDGLSLADRFHAQHREVPILLVSAFVNPQLEQRTSQRSFLTVMHKPIEYEALVSFLKRHLRAP